MFCIPVGAEGQVGSPSNEIRPNLEQLSEACMKRKTKDRKFLRLGLSVSLC